MQYSLNSKKKGFSFHSSYVCETYIRILPKTFQQVLFFRASSEYNPVQAEINSKVTRSNVRKAAEEALSGETDTNQAGAVPARTPGKSGVYVSTYGCQRN